MMYNGTDRVKQVNVLNELAEDIFQGLPVPEYGPDDITPEEVQAVLTLSSDAHDHEMPDWFDGHDLRYLCEQIKGKFQ